MARLREKEAEIQKLEEQPNDTYATSVMSSPFYPSPSLLSS